MKKYILINILLLVLMGCSKNKVEKNEERTIVKINYMMFAVDTYVSVTTTTIRTVSPKNISLTKKEIETLYKVLKKTTPMPKFDEYMVRLRIAIPNKKIIFLDANGVVLDGKEVKQIDILGLKTIENILEVNLGSEIGLYSSTLESDDKPKTKY